MSLVPAPIPARLGAAALALTAVTPVALGGLLALRTGHLAPLGAVPAVVFGTLAATSPALYIASAAVGTAPPLPLVARAFATALGAFGVALAGLILPAAFLALSSVEPRTAMIVASGAVGAAALLGLRRLAIELAPDPLTPRIGGSVVFLIWTAATLGIAARLWLDFAVEVLA
ncbi:MAG: hypothetical protein K8W52_32100 [Deltaproteobacteria bacterium]|nr:hypothetical protein [Deltaproteobacteria bacterium]